MDPANLRHLYRTHHVHGREENPCNNVGLCVNLLVTLGLFFRQLRRQLSAEDIISSVEMEFQKVRVYAYL